MKKILFGSAAAILSVVGMSSFSTAKYQTLFYFSTNNAVKIAQGGTVTPAQVTFDGTSAPTDPNCPAVVTNHYYCVIAVTANQVTAIHQSHLKASVSGSALQTVQTRTTIS